MKFFPQLLGLLLISLLASCTSHKKIAYLKDSDVYLAEESTSKLYDAQIMPKDLLTILVNSKEPDLASPYNLIVQTPISSQNRSIYSQPTIQTYLVDNEGNIEFPMLGKLHIGGMTKSQAEEFIVEKLKSSFKDAPIVTIRLVNYKVSVLGEVLRPGTFTVANEKINVFEALALAGDMTIWGRRENVKLIREDSSGKKYIAVLDLTKTDIIDSPYFYLQQNDVLYVEPNKAKAKNSDIGQSTTLIFSATSILISITNLLWNILK